MEGGISQGLNSTQMLGTGEITFSRRGQHLLKLRHIEFNQGHWCAHGFESIC